MVSLPEDASHTALLKSHCRGGNAHSFACVRLFPTGTQYPAGTPIWQCLAMTLGALHAK